MKTALLSLWTDESGSAATETALLIALVAVGTLGMIVGYAQRISDRLADMAHTLPTGEQATGIIVEGKPG